jgi:hypothetical protein
MGAAPRPDESGVKPMRDENRLFRMIIQAQLGIIAPSLYFLHGVLYHDGNASAASLTIYAIKISYVTTLLAVLFLPRVGVDLPRWTVISLILTYALISLTSLIGGGTHLTHLSPFYMFADLAGHWVTLAYTFVLLIYFRSYKCPSPLVPIVKLASIHLYGMTVALVAHYLYSGGEKVSTPYETQFVVSVSLATVLLVRRSYTNPHLIITCACILLMSVLTQMRIMMLSALVVLLGVAIYQLVVLGHFAKSVKAIALSSAMVIVAVLLFPAQLQDRWATLPFVGDPATQVVEGLGDESINQRFVEMAGVAEHVTNNPWVAIIGAGFGGTFINTGVMHDHYSKNQHHFHSTPLAIWFRLGLLGLGAYLALLICLIGALFSQNKFVFIVGMSGLMQWISGLTDLYYFWSFSFSFSVAALMYIKTSSR